MCLVARRSHHQQGNQRLTRTHEEKHEKKPDGERAMPGRLGIRAIVAVGRVGMHVIVPMRMLVAVGDAVFVQVEMRMSAMSPCAVDAPGCIGEPDADE